MFNDQCVDASMNLVDASMNLVDAAVIYVGGHINEGTVVTADWHGLLRNDWQDILQNSYQSGCRLKVENLLLS